MNQKRGQSLETIEAQIRELRQAIDRAQELKRQGGLSGAFRAAIERVEEIAKKLGKT